MKYEHYLMAMVTYKKLCEDFSEIHDFGFDLYEGKYKIVANVETLFDTVFKPHYTQEGIDWIYWFIYEADWGHKDFNKLKWVDGQIVEDKEEWGAVDAEGNPIAHSLESLWQLLERDYKIPS